MYTSTVKYLGGLRTECTHVKSQTIITTDAPPDNNGKGACFSPTDLIATSLASCVITIMGIYCENNNISFHHAEANVTKIMSSAPRKIEKIVIEMDLRQNNWDKITSQKVIRAGKACPVAQTLGNQVELDYTFIV